MKLSVSLPDEDVEFIDVYAANQGVESRSAVLHRALRLLQAAELSDEYEAAWDEWTSDGPGPLWEITAADGIIDASR
jgi:Arc/MetJ-type ribon-helix-helix transcriptional regulator